MVGWEVKRGEISRLAWSKAGLSSREMTASSKSCDLQAGWREEGRVKDGLVV